MIEIKMNTAEIVTALQNIAQSNANTHGLLKNIGEHLVNTTKQRFITSTAPDGSKWAANAQATYLKLLGAKHSNSKYSNKGGKVNKAGVNRVMSKRPLVQSFALGTEIHYQLVHDGLEVGSNKVYAPMMQFGGKKSQFPNLWGDVPARPFLGLSAEDEGAILRMAVEHMQRAMR